MIRMKLARWFLQRYLPVRTVEAVYDISNQYPQFQLQRSKLKMPYGRKNQNQIQAAASSFAVLHLGFLAWC
jgi:hypothetical protein